ncbi:MAG: peroxiredoxin [Pikeienuella sp.]
MPITAGENLPEATLIEMTAKGPVPVTISDLTKGRRVAMFAVPGAFTPGCHHKHMPSFVASAAELSAKGVDDIVCLSVNDPFVMQAWGEATGANGAGIRMLADADGSFTEALGLAFSAAPAGLHGRSQRYSMLVEDGEVKILNVDEPGQIVCSLGEALVDQF